MVQVTLQASGIPLHIADPFGGIAQGVHDVPQAEGLTLRTQVFPQR